MEVKILGGGIQGISTALILEELGYKTNIVADKLAYIDGRNNSDVSTNYAAASVNPGRLEANFSEEQLINAAESTFKPFFNSNNIPVRKISHYNLYEDENDKPDSPRMNAEEIDIKDSQIPKRRGEQVSAGYVFDEYFVEMPSYVPLLFKTYYKTGGEITRRNLSREEIAKLTRNNTIINCTGYGSRFLFNDTSMRALKGHIIEIPIGNNGNNNKNRNNLGDFAYTYYSMEYSGEAYMYPRDDKILFGGSALMGDIVDNKEWIGEKPELPMVLDGEIIPERIYKVNKEIMGKYIPIRKDNLKVTYGFRPYREDGVRIERDGDVIHNYGHGGGGVALSWWSALKVAQEIGSVPEDTLNSVVTTIEKSR